MKKYWTFALICAMTMSMIGQAAPAFAAGDSDEDIAAEIVTTAETEDSGIVADSDETTAAESDAEQMQESDDDQTRKPAEEPGTTGESAEDEPGTTGDAEADEEDDENSVMLDGSAISVDTDYIEVYAGEEAVLAPYVYDTEEEDLLYQWYYLDANGDLQLIPGAEDPTYTVTEPKTGDRYYVCVYENGHTYDSDCNYFVIDVENDLEADIPWVSVEAGDSAEVTVNLTAIDLSKVTYRWYYSTDDGDETIEGADSAVYTIPAVNSENYRNLWCEIDDGYGNECFVDAEICVENNLLVSADDLEDGDWAEYRVARNSTVPMTVNVTANDMTGLTYEWKMSTDDGDSFTVIPGVTGDSYTTEPVTGRIVYECEVCDAYGETASQYFRVLPDSGLVIAGDEWNLVCRENGTVLELQTAFTINEGENIHYRWCYWNSSEDEYVDLPETGDSLTVTAAKQAREYLCYATDDYGYTEEQIYYVCCHNWVTRTVNRCATLTREGSKLECCDICEAVFRTTAIPCPKTFTLSATAYTYDGKTKAPALTIKDSKGQTISSSFYTLTKAYGKKVGTYTYKIVFKGEYSGTKYVSYTILPAGTSLSKVTAVSKGFKVTWKKQATQTTGYQIRYSTNAAMTGAKSVTVKKTSTTSKTVKKLSAKKKYYVQIRTYKTVSGKTYYSSWSKAESVTTKK